MAEKECCFVQVDCQEPPDADPHVRWCGRRGGEIPPPTRLGGVSSGSAGICDKTSEDHDKNARETDDDGSLLQPPFDNSACSLYGHQPRQSHSDSSDQNEIAQNAERLWRARNRCNRDKNKTKGNANRADDVERTGSDEVLSNP